jgi:hypothetical protein
MKTINYNIYLFSNLVKLYDDKFANEPYDIQFELLELMYNDFFNSKFNSDSLGEYQCIINYLKNKY